MDRKELKSKIPHGYNKEIAKRAGVTPSFVSNYFNNKGVNSIKVEMAALEIVAELSTKRNTLIGQITT